MTGDIDQNTALKAINYCEVFRLLNKPCSVEDLSKALNPAILKYKNLIANKEALNSTIWGSVKILSDLMVYISPNDHVITEWIKYKIKFVCINLGVGNIQELELVASLIPVCFLFLETKIKQKIFDCEKITNEEITSILKLPEAGYKLIMNIPSLQHIAKIVLYNRKNYDGTGFPFDNTKANLIPFGSRVLKILYDYLIILSNTRSHERAMRSFKINVSIYDPKVIEVFINSDLSNYRSLIDQLNTNNDFKLKSDAIILSEFKQTRIF